MKVGDFLFGTQYQFLKDLHIGINPKTDVFLVSNGEEKFVLRCQKAYKRNTSRICCTHEKYIQFLSKISKEEKEYFLIPKVLETKELILSSQDIAKDYIEFTVWPYAGRDLFELTVASSLNSEQLKKIHLRLIEILIILKKYGFVHRDLKIENVVVNRDIPFLIDWEFADWAGSIANGSVDVYMSPEFYNQRTLSSVTMDLWGLGTILFITWSKNGLPDILPEELVGYFSGTKISYKWRNFNFTQQQLKILQKILCFVEDRITPEELKDCFNQSLEDV